MIQDLKKLILKTVKSEKSILKGDEMCRSIVAVQNIKKKQNLNLEKKLDLLERYIPGIKTKSKTLDDLLEHSNVWEKEATKNCLKYLSSVGINLPVDRKKYMDGLTGSQEKKRVKELIEKTSKSTPNLSKKQSSIKRTSSVSKEEFIKELFSNW
jgi:hypothetical protein